MLCQIQSREQIPLVVWFRRYEYQSSQTKIPCLVNPQSIVYVIIHTPALFFYRALPEYLSDDLERIQRRALKIIHSDLSYSEALKVSVLQRLHERRESITTRLYHEVTNNPCHKLHSLLPKRNDCKYSLRNKQTFVVPRCKTDGCKTVSF